MGTIIYLSNPVSWIVLGAVDLSPSSTQCGDSGHFPLLPRFPQESSHWSTVSTLAPSTHSARHNLSDILKCKSDRHRLALSPSVTPTCTHGEVHPIFPCLAHVSCSKLVSCHWLGKYFKIPRLSLPWVQLIQVPLIGFQIFLLLNAPFIQGCENSMC